IHNIIFDPNLIKLEKKEVVARKTILYVGDIMLDRGVEYLMKKNGIDYPFEKIKSITNNIGFICGNLEGPIVNNPKNFSSKSMSFAFIPEMAETLASAGFNLFSLANNHTLNMGSEGLMETKELLLESGIMTIGDPLKCEDNFIYKDDGVIQMAFNKTFPNSCSDDEIAKTIEIVKKENSDDFLIVNIHWGEEYQAKNSIYQKQTAHAIITAGADLIIGHHPHVVQNIEIYNNKLIFYSLGNFIFDQYFSQETQESLGVKLEMYSNKNIYYLMPIQSELAQPSLMEAEQAKEFLNELSKKSSPELDQLIKTGVIEIPG
ncbi:MAG: CapA family protein, partial [Candidatus Parcubacteria bacterium]|nr:CapA family protein [Candidatus Parcubacteria bacterium]